MDPERMRLGEFVRERRIRLGVASAAMLARRAGVSKDRVAYLERGGGSPGNMAGSVLLGIAVALGVEPGRFLEWAVADSAPRAALGPTGSTDLGEEARNLAESVRRHPVVAAALVGVAEEGGTPSAALAETLLRAEAAIGPAFSAAVCRQLAREATRLP